LGESGRLAVYNAWGCGVWIRQVEKIAIRVSFSQRLIATRRSDRERPKFVKKQRVARLVFCHYEILCSKKGGG